MRVEYRYPQAKQDVRDRRRRRNTLIYIYLFHQSKEGEVRQRVGNKFEYPCYKERE